ncbi:hypothetical protein DNF23_53080, partial [Pseudomonas syringae pv. pisi]
KIGVVTSVAAQLIKINLAHAGENSGRYLGQNRYYKGFPIERKPNSFCLTPLHVPDRRKEGEGLRYYKRSS